MAEYHFFSIFRYKLYWNRRNSYTGISGSELTGVTRGVGTTLLQLIGCNSNNASNFFAWNAAASGDLVLAPGLWSLDNFGNKLIATYMTVRVLNGILQQQMQITQEQVL